MASEGEGASKIEEAVVVSTHPDVCIKDGAPVPYDLHGLASDDIRHSKDVRYTSKWSLNEASRLSTSYGDEPATAGVESGTVKGMCRPVDDFAAKVRVDGERAVRHDTVFEMNTNGPEGAANTKGKLVYVRDQRDMDKKDEKKKDDDFEKRRKETLAKLKESSGKSDFYNKMAEFDPKNADKWNEMAGVQERFRAGEAGYDDATRAYSESMRETLHQSTINMFEDGNGLRDVTSSSNTGLYDWYIRMHGTSFSENGAWNSDFLLRGGSVLKNTDPRMIKNAPGLGKGMWDNYKDNKDPYAKRAAEQVRERRKEKGLRVSRRPGELQPETERDREEYDRMQRELWPTYAFGA